MTVFERCKQRGYTDYITSSLAGELVARKFYSSQQFDRSLVRSEEPHGVFTVWNYPDWFAPFIDRAITEVNAEIHLMILKKRSFGHHQPRILST
jgi:hypothetical protein